MEDSSNVWSMHGLAWDDPWRIRSVQELIAWVKEIGFLPLFRNDIPGFSAEEHVSDLFWWTGDPEQDPWEWREQIARSGEVAYGKFFDGKAGFISWDWFPVFANYRRDGYDFDTRWEEGIANARCKRIMDVFAQLPEMSAVDLKRYAGFGKNGEKNFPGIVTQLQMQGYLVVRDFRKKISKSGREYGMPISIYTTPEQMIGYPAFEEAYRKDPADALESILDHICEKFTQADREIVKKLLI